MRTYFMGAPKAQSCCTPNQTCSIIFSFFASSLSNKRCFTRAVLGLARQAGWGRQALCNLFTYSLSLSLSLLFLSPLSLPRRSVWSCGFRFKFRAERRRRRNRRKRGKSRRGGRKWPTRRPTTGGDSIRDRPPHFEYMKQVRSWNSFPIKTYNLH